MDGLEDADGLEGGDVGRLAQELAQSTARVGAYERPEKLSGGRQGDATLRLWRIAIADRASSSSRLLPSPGSPTKRSADGRRSTVTVRPKVRIRSSSAARPMNGALIASEPYAGGIRMLLAPRMREVP